MRLIESLKYNESINTIDKLNQYVKKQYKKNFFYDMIDDINKGINNPIIIWGTYNNCLKLYKYLINHLRIDCIVAAVVNKKYLNNGLNNVDFNKSLPMYSLEEWLDSHDKTDIIIDFSFFHTDLIEGYREKIGKIYLGDIMGTFIFDKPYIITYGMFDSYYDRIEWTYAHLDKQSQQEFIAYIYQKMFGNYNKMYHKTQYFDKDIVTLSSDERYIDCGAFNGDSIVEFYNAVSGKYDKIIAYEMDDVNLVALQENINSYNVHDCKIIGCGVGEKHEIIKGTKGMNSTSYLGHGIDDVEVVSIDDTVDGKVTFIKMDIEGFELQALKGAKNTIIDNKPKLAICMYHKFEDLWEIPQYILSIVPEYKLYFRNYHNSASECILYALCEN